MAVMAAATAEIVRPDTAAVRWVHPWDAPSSCHRIFRCFEDFQRAHARGHKQEAAALMAELERLTMAAKERDAARHGA